MPDYQLSKIYKLWSPSTNLIYIGSTTQTISQRLADHIAVYKRFKNGKGNNITSFKVLECEDYKIELIELYPCNNREQLFKKEGEHIKNLDCVNRCIMGRTKKEYFEENKEKNKEKRDKYLKEYYEKNKEKLIEKVKQYRGNNNEKLKEKLKEYAEKNKERLKEKRKEYYEKNKEKSKEYYENNKVSKQEYDKRYYEKKKLEKIK